MRFVHIADVHLDRPFVNLSDKDSLGDIKRLEQRNVFRKIVEYIKENNIPYLFISGDLYEHEYIKRTTIEYIDKLFSEIPETKIYITPGNHDPYLKNSFYNKFIWNNNVKIFNSIFEKVENDDVDIYGYGFDDFYCKDCNIENLKIENKNKINILILHATLDGANIEEKQYNSISKKILEEKGFDYIALGHIHKTNYDKNERIIYPGSLSSLGFDELGGHGMIVGEITKERFEIQKIDIEQSEFKEIKIDITNILSIEDLIEKINELNIRNDEYIKVILEGKRNFEINIYDLYKLIFNNRIIKIKDKTKLNINLEELSNETTLKGLFIKEILEKINDKNISEEEKERLEKAVEIGLEALN